MKRETHSADAWNKCTKRHPDSYPGLSVRSGIRITVEFKTVTLSANMHLRFVIFKDFFHKVHNDARIMRGVVLLVMCLTDSRLCR